MHRKGMGREFKLQSKFEHQLASSHLEAPLNAASGNAHAQLDVCPLTLMARKLYCV